MKYDKICLNYAIIELHTQAMKDFSQKNILYYNFMGIIMRRLRDLSLIKRWVFY